MRVATKGLAQVREAFFVMSLTDQDIAKITVSLREIGVELEGLEIALGGVRKAFARRLRQAKIVIRPLQYRRKADGFFVLAHRFFELPPALQYAAQRSVCQRQFRL